MVHYEAKCLAMNASYSGSAEDLHNGGMGEILLARLNYTVRV